MDLSVSPGEGGARRPGTECSTGSPSGFRRRAPRTTSRRSCRASARSPACSCSHPAARRSARLRTHAAGGSSARTARRRRDRSGSRAPRRSRRTMRPQARPRFGYLPLGGDYTISGNRPGNEAGRLTAVTRGFAAAATTTAGGGGPGRQAAASQSVRDRLEVAGSKREATFTPGAAGNETLTSPRAPAAGRCTRWRWRAAERRARRTRADRERRRHRHRPHRKGGDAHAHACVPRALRPPDGRPADRPPARLGRAGGLACTHWFHLRGVTAERRRAGRTSRSAIVCGR